MHNLRIGRCSLSNSMKQSQPGKPVFPPSESPCMHSVLYASITHMQAGVSQTWLRGPLWSLVGPDPVRHWLRCNCATTTGGSPCKGLSPLLDNMRSSYPCHKTGSLLMGVTGRTTQKQHTTFAR